MILGYLRLFWIILDSFLTLNNLKGVETNWNDSYNLVLTILQHEDPLGLSMSPISSRHLILDDLGVFSAIFGPILTIFRP